jgi:hypothetical protein
MKEFLKQEILLALFILVVQIIAGFLVAHFILHTTWDLKSTICDYSFIVFWGLYLIIKICIALFKRVKSQKDENI